MCLNLYFNIYENSVVISMSQFIQQAQLKAYCVMVSCHVLYILGPVFLKGTIAKEISHRLARAHMKTEIYKCHGKVQIYCWGHSKKREIGSSCGIENDSKVKVSFQLVTEG